MARVLLECCGCGDSSNASSFIEEQVARVVGCLGGSLKGHMPQSHAHHSHDALNGGMRMHGSKKKGWTEIMQEIIPSYLQRIVEQIVVELTHCG
jgi:hypothetical protein